MVTKPKVLKQSNQEEVTNLAVHKRLQTAEGWKRAQARKVKPSKKSK